MWHGVEELADVALEEIPVFPRKAKRTIHRRQLSLALPAGVGVEHKPLLDPRLQNVHERMVQHPLAERRRAHDALFRLIDGEPAVFADGIGSVRKARAQPRKLRVEVRRVFTLIFPRPLAPRRLPERKAQVFHVQHGIEKIARPLHGVNSSLSSVPSAAIFVAASRIASPYFFMRSSPNLSILAMASFVGGSIFATSASCASVITM